MKILSLLFLISGLVAAHAEETKLPHPCDQDRQELCPSFSGPEEAKNCMYDNRAKLRGECKELMNAGIAKDKAEKAKKREQQLKTCEADAKKLCKNVKKGESESLLACLTKAQSKVTEPCRAALAL